MEISGKIIAILPIQSGTGKNGTEWKKQEYVIETADQYPKHCCFAVWGNRVDEFGIQEGQDLDVSINVDAREYNGKWYNDLQAWKVVQRNVHIKETSQTQYEQITPKEKDGLPF